jgi:hypothetical protein
MEDRIFSVILDCGIFVRSIDFSGVKRNFTECTRFQGSDQYSDWIELCLQMGIVSQPVAILESCWFEADGRHLR